MANQYRGTDKDIHTRIFKYVIRGIKLIKKLPRTPENIPIIQQISSSLTSMGANDQEADAASSKKDFISKYSIVKKETKESIYWWEVIQETIIKDPELIWLIDEGREILNVVSTILINSQH